MSAAIRKIDFFDGTEYDFLSNFHMAALVFDGQKYTCSECAYQAAKCREPRQRALFYNLGPGAGKKLGNQIKLRPDWEEVKDQVMRDVLFAKFTQNPELAKRLIGTGNAELIEGNTWFDRYWGVYKGIGLNKLGILLMELRELLPEHPPV